MSAIIRGSLIGPLFLFIISLFLIIIGAVLTISIIFIFIGIPLLIIGVILMLFSILVFFGATLEGIASLFRPKKKMKLHIKEKPKRRKKKGKIVEMTEEEGVYKAK